MTARSSAMKSISLARASSSAACLLLLIAPATQAQEAQPACLRFVNATGVGESLTVRVNGDPLQARGYLSGQATGRLEVAAGPCHIELHHPRLGRFDLPLELPAGSVRTVVALIEAASATETPRPPPKLTCHILLQPPPGPPKQRRLQILQATPHQQLDLHVAGHKLHCQRLRVKPLDIEQPQPLLEHAGQALARLPFDEAGEGTLILFADDGGRLRHLFFFDPAGSSEAPDERR